MCDEHDDNFLGVLLAIASRWSGVWKVLYEAFIATCRRFVSVIHSSSYTGIFSVVVPFYGQLVILVVTYYITLP